MGGDYLPRCLVYEWCIYMNIFYVHKDPVIAAQMMCDKHVVKMVIETAQMLCVAHTGNNRYRAERMGMYKPAHVKHPSTRWARENQVQYEWLYRHFVALCDEYTHRYGKVHMTDQKLRKKLADTPSSLPKGEFSDPPQCMFDDVKIEENTVEAYRNYYRVYKRGFARWTGRNVPDWFTETNHGDD